KSEKIIGMNQYELEQEEEIDILDIDNTLVRNNQIDRINRVKESRNEEEVKTTLEALTETVRTGEGNLLEKAVDAARARATIGEISDAIEDVTGRHKAVIQSVSGVYSSNFSRQEEIEEVKEMTEEFLENEGRRPRILVAKMGQDGHDRGSK